MVREVDLVTYLPPYLKNYQEQVAALEAENPEFILIWNGVDRVLYNHFISTADSYGISRYEKIMGIVPTEDDNLESRRSRVQVNWVNLLPYTMKTFLQKLNVLCGSGNYILSCSFSEEYYMKLITHLDNAGQVDELRNLFEEILPCNLVVDSFNEIPVISTAGTFFGARPTTHVDLIITTDWSETLRPEGAGVYYGAISDTSKVMLTMDFHETASPRTELAFVSEPSDTVKVQIQS